MKLEIVGNYIRKKKKPNDLLLNLFKGKKIMKIYNIEIAKQFVDWFNNKS
jgi:hypothetical protein